MQDCHMEQGSAPEDSPGRDLHQDKGRRILEAAMEIFSIRPYHQVKVEDIAVRARVGKGTVYEYYRSKNELFLAVFEEAGRIYMGEMEASLDRDGSAVEKFQVLVATHIAFIMKHRQRAILMVSQQRQVAPREVHQAFLKRQGRLLSLVRDTIHQGIREGAFRPVDGDLASLFVMGGILSLWPLALKDRQAALQKKGNEVVDLVLRCLQG